MKRAGAWAALALAYTSSVGVAQDGTRGGGTFVADSVLLGGRVYRYAVQLPDGYTASRAWPVILGLHGAGSRGSDGVRQRGQSLAEAARAFPDRFPAILVLPQCPAGERWRGEVLEAALQALERTLARYAVDRERLYLTGQSMGGDGVLRAAVAQQRRFAAAVVVAGVLEDPRAGSTLRDLPLWVFHGELDRIPVERARGLVETLRAEGAASVRYIEIPGAGHEIFDEVYRREDLAAWLFAQRWRSPGS